MTKPFRVWQEVTASTRALREGTAFPPSLHAHLQARGIDTRQSVLLAVTPDPFGLDVEIVTPSRTLIRFFAELDPTPWTSWGEARVVALEDWHETDLSTTDSWWREHPRMTRPRPNNPIWVALQILDGGGVSDAFASTWITRDGRDG